MIEWLVIPVREPECRTSQRSGAVTESWKAQSGTRLINQERGWLQMMHTVDDVAVLLAYVQCSQAQWVTSSPPRLDPPPLELPTFALPPRPLELPEALEVLLDLAAPFGISTSERLFSKARTRFSKYVLVTLPKFQHTKKCQQAHLNL